MSSDSSLDPHVEDIIHEQYARRAEAAAGR